MQAVSLPFFYGWLWVREGYRLFMRQPMAMLFWSLVTNLLIHLSYLLPLLGQIALLVASPALTFIVLNASHNIAKGQQMQLGMWTAPLRPANVRNPLIKLGTLYMLACLAAGLLATIPFVDSIMSVMPEPGTPVDEAAFMRALRAPMFALMGIYVLVSAIFWHAPALIGWHHIAIKQALFYSMVACWRNKLPFILYGLCWLALYFFMQQLDMVLLASGLAPSLQQLILTPLSLVILAVLYGSFYPIYLTVFGPSAMALKAAAQHEDADQ